MSAGPGPVCSVLPSCQVQPRWQLGSSARRPAPHDTTSVSQRRGQVHVDVTATWLGRAPTGQALERHPGVAARVRRLACPWGWPGRWGWPEWWGVAWGGGGWGGLEAVGEPDSGDPEGGEDDAEDVHGGDDRARGDDQGLQDVPAEKAQGRRPTRPPRTRAQMASPPPTPPATSPRRCSRVMATGMASPMMTASIISTVPHSWRTSLPVTTAPQR